MRAATPGSAPGPESKIQVSSPAEAFSGFNPFRGNEVRGNSEIDCIDMTVGAGTAGTANLWKSNKGGTCSPPGLFKSP
jgi:hypothetical protein